jgi:hypothetical protein
VRNPQRSRSASRPPMLISDRRPCSVLMIAPSSLFWGDVHHRRPLADPLLLGHWLVADQVLAECVRDLPGMAPMSWIAVFEPEDARGDVGRHVLAVGRVHRLLGTYFWTRYESGVEFDKDQGCLLFAGRCETDENRVQSRSLPRRRFECGDSKDPLHSSSVAHQVRYPLPAD